MTDDGSGRLKRLRGAARAPVVAALAGGNLLLRGVAEAGREGLGAALAWLSESVVGTVALSTASAYADGFAALAAGLELLLVGYVVYVSLPWLLPAAVEDLAADRGVRLLSVVVTLSLTGVLLLVGSGLPTATAHVVMVLATVAFAGYVLWTQPDPFDPEEGYVVAVVNLLGGAPEEPPAEAAAPVRVALLVAVGMFLTTACVFYAVTTYALGQFWPAVEVVALAAAATTALPTRGPEDPEGRVVGALRAALAVPGKGLFGLTMVAVGLFAALPAFALVAGLLARTSPNRLAALLSTPAGWVRLATLVGLAGFALYCPWYWLRVSARFPAMLRETVGEVPPDLHGPVPALPGGALVAPAGLVVLPAALSTVPALGGSLPALVAAALLWAGCLLATVATGLGRGATGRPVARDNLVVPVAFAAQLVGAVAVSALAAGSPVPRWTPVPVVPPSGLFVVPAAVGAYLLPDGVQLLERGGSPAPALAATAVAAAGGAGFLGAYLGTGPVGAAGGGLVVLALGLAMVYNARQG